MEIYVGGIPFKFKEADLREIFEPYGEVGSVTIILDKITRQNKGFGFVVMEDDEEANKAIEGLNDTDVEGRTLVVNKSEPKKESDNRSGFKGYNKTGNYGGGGSKGSGFNKGGSFGKGGGFSKGGFTKGGGFNKTGGKRGS
jgi:RNA recognition motif-containing protein